jgi:hypothetical protein
MSQTNHAETEALLEQLLDASLGLMESRAMHCLTVADWLVLARAIAKAKGEPWKAADFLRPEDLENIAEDCADEWDEATDGPLPSLEG